MTKKRVAIIGCGGIANSKHMPALAKKSDRVEIVAFCDLIEEAVDCAFRDQLMEKPLFGQG